MRELTDNTSAHDALGLGLGLGCAKKPENDQIIRYCNTKDLQQNWFQTT